MSMKNSQENNCARVLAVLATLFKKRLRCNFFPVNVEEFPE